MRSAICMLVGVVVAAALTTPDAQAQQQFQIFGRFVDGAGLPVTNLTPGDVTLMENGIEVKVTQIKPVDWPLRVQVLVDNGVGLGGQLSDLRTGVRRLFEALPAGVEASLVSTASIPRQLVRRTADRQAWARGLGLLSLDLGVGRFVESLNEALQRVEREPGGYFSVIILVGTTVGDTNVMERDVERIMQRLEQRPTTVHVVVLSGPIQSGTPSGNQTEVGIAVAQSSGGKYENITVANRLATLLPEIGRQVAQSYQKTRQHVLIVAQRAAGNAASLGPLSIGVPRGLSATVPSLDGRLP